jgi:hypothetical protein
MREVMASSTISILIIDQYFNDTDYNTGEDGPLWKKPTMYTFNFGYDNSFV